MKRRNLLPTLVLPMAMVSGAVAAQPYQGGSGDWGFGHMMNWGGGWGGMIVGPIMMIVMLVLVIVIAVAVLRWLGVIGSAGRQADGKESALEILERRFARGEIDEAELKDRKKAPGL